MYGRVVAYEEWPALDMSAPGEVAGPGPATAARHPRFRGHSPADRHRGEDRAGLL